MLDFGTGAGSVLYPMAMKVAPSGSVVGIEKSEYWVKQTSEEISRCGIENAEILLMDGREMTFVDNSFDHVAAGFIGWDNYFDFRRLEYRKSDPDPMVSEIRRVLKSGGLFGLSTWLVQADLDWMHQFLSGQSIACNTNYSAENEKGWRIIMERGGFTDIEFLSHSVSYTYESKEIWWKEMRDYDWTEEKNDNELITGEVKEQAFQEIQGYCIDKGGVQFTREALFVRGRKE